MKTTLQIAKALALFGLFALAVSVADVVRRLPIALHEEIAALTDRLDNRVAVESSIAMAIADDRMKQAIGELTETRKILDKRTDAIVKDAAATLAGLSGIAYHGTGAVIQELDAFRQQLEPIEYAATVSMLQIAALAKSSQDAVDDANPEVIKLLRDARLATAQTARAAGQIERAMPEILADVQRATDASAEASEHASATFANLEKQTKPTRLWLRLAPEALRTAIIAIGFLR